MLNTGFPVDIDITFNIDTKPTIFRDMWDDLNDYKDSIEIKSHDGLYYDEIDNGVLKKRHIPYSGMLNGWGDFIRTAKRKGI